MVEFLLDWFDLICMFELWTGCGVYSLANGGHEKQLSCVPRNQNDVLLEV